ncbi:hypothetical protein pdul_cds_142 [Pandoravirus dulcis]|uniref:Uncharacterized protein n=1 Tax=Pandoravirus dulcis TaxID=1349409 RepID=S4VVU3_9VIRU|nr:hypothetical protein pdul_cds_142 [Pandoravirus dulcis]AGO82064.1 hypothetical protein pdul_cds_142 [Pandoravirus dulcis]
MQSTGIDGDGYDNGQDEIGSYTDQIYSDQLYGGQVYDENGDNEEEEQGQYASIGDDATQQGPQGDLVDLMSADVFYALVRSLLAQGRASDAAALCSSSPRARAVCRQGRINWARAFPDLESAYGASGTAGGPPLSALAISDKEEGDKGGTRYSLLQTALAARRARVDARLHQQHAFDAARFCALYALYARDQIVRVASERQRAHARDVESGAASQIGRVVLPAAEPSPAPLARGRGIGQALRRMVPGPLRGSPFRRALQREVAPHHDVVDVLRSPDDLSLADLEAWARGLTGISGYPSDVAFAGFEPWAVVQLGDEPQVPFDADAGPLFYVTNISPPIGAAANLDDRRFRIDRRTGARPDPRDVIGTDLDEIAHSAAPPEEAFRALVRYRVGRALSEALSKPIRLRTGPAWETKKRGVQRPARRAGETDPSEATLEALRRLVGRCEQVDVYAAYAPVATYLAARPFGDTGLITYDVIIRLPLV